MVYLVSHSNVHELTQTRVNVEGSFVYIKYHFLADGGQKQFTRQEAVRLSGENADYSKEELWEGIEKGEYPYYTCDIQTMAPEQADSAKLGFDPFDVTKVWPRSQFPVSSGHRTSQWSRH
jgi:catalase